MTVRKVVAGSVLAAGLGVAGVFGTGTASAGPGISFDPGTVGEGTIGFGDQTETGAYARATPGNVAFAVSLGAPAAAVTLGNGRNNGTLAVGVIGPALAGVESAQTGQFNGAAALLGGTSVVSTSGSRNQSVTVGGVSTVSGINVNDNHILSVGSEVSSTGSTNNTAAFCGGSLNAQSATLKTNKLPAGPGSIC